MKVEGRSVVVTGGASGLGRASAEKLVGAGARVVILDLPTSAGDEVANALGAEFAPADVTDPVTVESALDLAESAAPLAALIHCAGRGGPVRLVGKDGQPGDLTTFEDVVRLNLVGTFNMLRLAATRMAANEPVDGERGVCVLTASVAAYEGQIGQIPYASAKAGIVGMTLVAARDLSSRLIRVATIAPGLFDTPILDRLSPGVKDALATAVPHPHRLGHPEEYASLAEHIIANPMINGETIRLDGAIRMSPR